MRIARPTCARAPVRMLAQLAPATWPTLPVLIATVYIFIPLVTAIIDAQLLQLVFICSWAWVAPGAIVASPAWQVPLVFDFS